MLIALVAVDQQNSIGYRGQMCFHCPDDLTFFKETTLGGVVICGSVTLRSFPEGLPLVGRETWVLSRKMRDLPALDHRPARLFHDLETLQRAMKKERRPLWLAGGASVYEALLPCCDEAWVTRFEARCQQADAAFPDLEHHPLWKCYDRRGPFFCNGLAYDRWYYRRSD